ncbi:3TM-type holin [Moritella sp.]|uniref:3TM-type holin n=1 Tax=Moritella sp. TaxID=78556 RepID=UPI0025D43928|nr:3TM-type holin [Moritella sp.]MCJ8349070.1 holin family protein [Moritella sp.]
MWQSIMDFVSRTFKPAADLIDNIHTSEEEKLKLKNVLVELQNEVTKKHIELVSKQMDLERTLLDAQSSIIQKEASSGSWITRSWRPITMLCFLAIVILNALGIITLEEKFAHDFMQLVEIGLGGYVIGRSAEKVIPSITKALGSK